MSDFDRLPTRAAAIRRVEAGLISHFAACGYDEVIVPMVEPADVYVAADAPRLVQGERVLALRGDFTGPLARLVSTRLADEDGPIRLAYRGIVFRGAVQNWQAGCESFGTSGGAGDVEVLRVALGAVDALGVRGARAVVGSVAALDAARPGASADAAIREALDRRDPTAVQRWPELAGLIRTGDSSATTRAPAGALRGIEQLLAGLGPDAARVEIDLAHVRRFPYYTGIVFDLFAPGIARPLGGGGRYDGLCARYGRPRPAVGFSLDVERLAEVVS